MKQNKEASILIYILILVIITMFLWMIVFQNNSTIRQYKKIENIDAILLNWIYSKWKLAIKYTKELNSNWSWYIDNFSCPNAVTMSWIINLWINSTSLYSPTSSNIAYCSWTYLWNNFWIFFNTNYNNFSWAIYKSEKENLVDVWWWIFEAQFSDSDITKISFNGTSLAWIDNIDDNFNSDNYRTNSTWSVASWINYPNDDLWNPFEDDDVKARKISYSYIYPSAWLVNVFWNNYKTDKIIDENTNNNDNINVKIWNTSTWILHFDIDGKIDLKVVEFNKSRFKDYWELLAIKTYNYSSTGWKIWYLQNNSWLLSFSDIPTTSDFIFDFKNNDYWIFMENTSTWTILYRIKWYEKPTMKWIYLVPFDDSDDIIIKYLWASIIKKGSDYIYKILEILDTK